MGGLDDDVTLLVTYSRPNDLNTYSDICARCAPLSAQTNFVLSERPPSREAAWYKGQVTTATFTVKRRSRAHIGAFEVFDTLSKSAGSTL